MRSRSSPVIGKSTSFRKLFQIRRGPSDPSVILATPASSMPTLEIHGSLLSQSQILSRLFALAVRQQFVADAGAISEAGIAGLSTAVM